MKKLLIFTMMAMLAGTLAAQITDPTYWDRKQLYANWLYDYDTVRINRLHIENQTGFDSTGNLFMYRGTTPANGKLLIGNGSGFVMANLSSSDGSVNITNGAGTIDLAASVSGGDISGLTENYIQFGASDGSLDESSFLQYSSSIYSGYGAGLSIHNTNAVATLPSFSMIELISDEAGSELHLQGALSSGIRYLNSGGTSQWFIYMDDADEILRIRNITEDKPLYITGSSMRFSETTVSEYGFYWDDGGYKITNNDNPAVFTLDQNGTVCTFTNDGTGLQIDADEVEITNDFILSGIPGTGNILHIDGSGDVTKGGDKMIFGGNQDVQMPGSATAYTSFYATSTAIEARRQVAVPVSGTLKNLYVTMLGTQPATGSLVITIRKNGVNQAVTVTVPANDPGGVHSDTVNDVSFTAGDLLSIELQNNASTTAARLVSIVCTYEY